MFSFSIYAAEQCGTSSSAAYQSHLSGEETSVITPLSGDNEKTIIERPAPELVLMNKIVELLDHDKKIDSPDVHELFKFGVETYHCSLSANVQLHWQGGRFVGSLLHKLIEDKRDQDLVTFLRCWGKYIDVARVIRPAASEMTEYAESHELCALQFALQKFSEDKEAVYKTMALSLIAYEKNLYRRSLLSRLCSCFCCRDWCCYYPTVQQVAPLLKHHVQSNYHKRCRHKEFHWHEDEATRCPDCLACDVIEHYETRLALIRAKAIEVDDPTIHKAMKDFNPIPFFVPVTWTVE